MGQWSLFRACGLHDMLITSTSYRVHSSVTGRREKKDVVIVYKMMLQTFPFLSKGSYRSDSGLSSAVILVTRGTVSRKIPRMDLKRVSSPLALAVLSVWFSSLSFARKIYVCMSLYISMCVCMCVCVCVCMCVCVSACGRACVFVCMCTLFGLDSILLTFFF